MNAPTDLMHTLAWSLLHFVWQGAAIAAFAAALMYVLRKPATRYLIGVGALALMLLSFADCCRHVLVRRWAAIQLSTSSRLYRTWRPIL